MKISLEALAVLDAIDRKGSFAAAAATLHRVPSAISYTVRKLEEDLDIVLFQRHGQRSVLTPAGVELLRQGRHLLNAAHALEQRVRRVATGWETELHIAVDSIIPVGRFLPVLEDFYAQRSGTGIRLSVEVYGGTWDALMSGRADLVIGAPGEGPSGGGYNTYFLGNVRFLFAVALDHPLAQADEPLTGQEILQYRAVSAADSSRILAPRSSGLLEGQEVLTVPDLRSKLEAQCMGLGVGFVPAHLLGGDIREGRLRVKAVEDGKADLPLWLAWRTAHVGKALLWFICYLEQPAVRAALLAEN